MPQRLQRRALRISQRTGLGHQHIRQILMMDTGCADDLCRAPAIKEIQRGKQHHADDEAAAGRTHHHDLVRRFDERWRHRGEHALAGRDGIRFLPNQTIAVRHARLHREIIHLVVEEHAGSADHQTRTETEVQRQRGGNAITLTIDNREMRGLWTLRGARTDAGQIGAGQHMSTVNGGREASRIIRTGESRHRHADEIRITEIERTIAMESSLGFDDQMLACQRIDRTEIEIG